jgi:hypothetical protein
MIGMPKQKTCPCGCGCTCMCGHGKKKIAIGIGLFIFGLVKYWGYSWEMAFMVVGVLAVLYGIVLKMGCSCYK